MRIDVTHRNLSRCIGLICRVKRGGKSLGDYLLCLNLISYIALHKYRELDTTITIGEIKL